ncbi:MAG: hypothetical protein U0V73_10580 [Acidimicrobiia bacterium]
MSETETANPQALPPAKVRRPHRVLVALLLVLGAVLTPITILTLFVNVEVKNTDRYVQTVEPLAKDPAVRAYVADEVTRNLFARVDVEGYVKDALPSKAQGLSGAITGALKNATHTSVERVLESDQFQTVWEKANRAAHAELVKMLTNEGSGKVLTSRNGRVSVDLSALGTAIKQRLDDTGIGVFEKIPTDRLSGKITLFESKDLYRIRRATGALSKLAFVLPFVVVACLGGAILLSQNRRRGFIWAAVAFTLGAMVLAIGLAIGRGVYLNAAVDGGIPHDSAATAYDTMVRFLHTSVRAVLSLSIVMVVAAVFSGPSKLAVWFRATVHRVVTWLGRQSSDAGWGWLGSIGFVRANKRVIRIVVAVAGFVLLFFWKHPTPSVIFWIAAVVLFLLGLVEFFGREPDETALAPTAS